ncbi:MAG: hypothetical protein U1E77_11820 [Inhella sp.]
MEYRYTVYERPKRIDAVCDHCGKPFVFHSEPPSSEKLDSGGEGPIAWGGAVEGEIKGQGACPSCTRQAHTIAWPAAARYQVALREGLFWCWNAQQLPALRAKIAGDRHAIRAIERTDWQLTRILGRVPKFALLLRNRPRLLRELDRWIQEAAESPEG